MREKLVSLGRRPPRQRASQFRKLLLVIRVPGQIVLFEGVPVQVEQLEFRTCQFPGPFPLLNRQIPVVY